MSERAKLLIQLDTDPHPSVFDRVVAVDAGADHLFSYGAVRPEQVMGLVHGAIFTRGPKDLHRTAIFIGGSDVAAGETLLAEVRQHLLPKFGLQVSVLLDSNGCNTTAAAAVRAAEKHLDLSQCRSLVLGGTGPVGQRVARLLARAGGEVRIGSRQKDKADAVCAAIRAAVPNAKVSAVVPSGRDAIAAVGGQQLIVAAGAAGVVLLPKSVREQCDALQGLIDLNAVPPLGIEGVEVHDRGTQRDGVWAYGALGVGALKMKIHKAAVAALFERNDRILDADEVFDLAGSAV